MFSPENVSAVINIACVVVPTVASMVLLRRYIESRENGKTLTHSLECAAARETRLREQLTAVRYQLAKYQERTEDTFPLRWSFIAHQAHDGPRLDIFEDEQYIVSVPLASTAAWRDLHSNPLEYDCRLRLFAHVLPEPTATTTNGGDNAADSAVAFGQD